MCRHKWRLDGKECRCGWCQTRLPNTPASRSAALNSPASCDRKTPEQRRAEDAAADAVDAEIAEARKCRERKELLEECIQYLPTDLFLHIAKEVS